ncbi:MAG: hypothetical protein QOG86_708 [Thermoleophilaceae bacterium]|nr:hypothetical protein [Thermoleophilaceae bacterium]
MAVAASGDASERELSDAEAVGRALASRGAVVVTGGRGGGMEAACRGAKSAGGTTVGILPGSDRAEGNAHLDVVIPTGLGEARNALVVRAADALVAVGGSWGTLSEIALAMRAGKRVVGLGTWEVGKGGEPVKGVVVAADAEQAAELALG